MELHCQGICPPRKFFINVGRLDLLRETLQISPQRGAIHARRVENVLLTFDACLCHEYHAVLVLLDPSELCLLSMHGGVHEEGCLA